MKKLQNLLAALLLWEETTCWIIRFLHSTQSVNLVYVGNALSEKQIELINEKADIFSIDQSKLSVTQGFSTTEKSSKNTEIDNLKMEISRLNQELKNKDELLKANNNQKLIGNQLLSELNSLYPNIYSCAYSESVLFQEGMTESNPIAMILVKTKAQKLKTTDKDKIRKWMKNRFSSKQIEVYFD